MDDVQRGNRDHFISQLVAHQRQLYQYISTLLPRYHDADDVMQNTLMVLWEKFEQFDPGTNFYAWAKRIAYLQMRSYRRQKNRLVTILDESVFEEIAARIESSWDALQGRRRDAMARCAERLGPADRLLLRLRYEPGATIEEVARQLGRPAVSVRNSLARIRRVLCECITAEIVAGEEHQAKGESGPKENQAQKDKP